MAVTYKKLFHLLIDRDIYISLESVEKICRVLNCKVDDIVEFIPDDQAKKKK